MSTTKPKIVVKTAASSASLQHAKMPAASTVATAKVVTKKVAVAAPAPTKKAASKKAVVVEEVESEMESEMEEVAMTPAQIIASMEEQLSALRVALKVKGLTKSGKPRKQREYTGPSEAQAAWNAYVQEVREEHGYEEDEEGNAVLDKKGEPKWALSYKDAMQIAGQRRKEASGSDNSSVVSAASSVKKPAAKKAVATTVKAVAAPAKAAAKAPVKAAAAPAVRKSAAELVGSDEPASKPARKSASELKAEFLAKKAAAAAEAEAAASVPAEDAAEEEAAEDGGEAVEWEFEGQNYFKTGDNLCWLQTEDGDRVWAGVFLPAENRIDDSVAEPQFE